MDGTTKTLQDAVYAFNSQNNITGITNTSSEYTAAYNYNYDGLNRLTAADGQYQESADNYTKTFRQSFAYAKNGNLLSKRNHNFNDNTLIDEWNYQYSNHQVTQIDSTQSGNDRLVMSYDSSGNMTYQRDNFKDLTKTITVDSQNRITQVQDALSTTIGNYYYDEGGFRVRKKALVPSGASFKNQEILYPSKFYGLEYSEETNILSSINNVYLNGVRIAALNEDGVTAYFLTDQVDSVAHVLDEGAHTLSRMQYEPYGETLVQRGTLDFAPKYNSQELDRETNFYFYNARYYDPQIARFTSADTIIDGARNTQGWNRFSYVAGNPIRYKDPTGHNAVPKKLLPSPYETANSASPAFVPRNSNGVGSGLLPSDQKLLGRPTTPEIRPLNKGIDPITLKPKVKKSLWPEITRKDVWNITKGVGREAMELSICGFGFGQAPSCDSKLINNHRSPDYMSAQGSGRISKAGEFTAGGGYMIDRYGTVYESQALSGGSLTKAFSGNASYGWVLSWKQPNKAEMENIMTGEGVNFNVNIKGVGAGLGYSPGTNNFTFEIGVGSPGGGGSRTNSSKVTETKYGW
ncbi:RHS repeat-associated core domain-containing protein [Leptospira dzoumogneensis]|uniref:RHS repeat-associated core domain-containing protein n=1 Tax=Leptospira dzoumogneensis TaxID=2484904 RepID=UPI00313446A4